MRPVLIGWLAILFASAAQAADVRDALFPFPIPIDQTVQGVADVSFLNAKPADDLVTVRDGHFYAAGKPIRFFGACVIGQACFPTHEEAAVIARRLASVGMNQVRIHLIDGHDAPLGLFDPAHKGELRILASQLDKLDFFIAELKKRGIYVELPVNGYHWRNITGPTDYPDADFKQFAPFGSGIPLWNPRFIETEKRFAREFFTHVNPYTGQAYAKEPCVSTMEIVNENGLLCAWRGEHFRKVWSPAMIADLQGHWNAFLRSRHATTARVREAWAQGEIRADGREMLRNPDFAAGSKGWHLQVVQPSVATLQIESGGGPQGRSCAVLQSDRAADHRAMVIINQPGLAVEEGIPYKLTFLARAETAADAPVALNLSVAMNHAPWIGVGLSRLVSVGPEWREVTLFFHGTQHEPDAKLMVMPPLGASRVRLAAFSLQKSDVTGLPAGESLEAGRVSMPLAPSECLRRTRGVAADFVDFLYELDGRYFDAMRDYLRNDLGCRHPIKGTQVDEYSSYFSQSRYDYLDAHGYWEHPHFPRKPWDRQDWSVGNSPMVNRGAQVVVNLAGRRVFGKPFNVSEYCHPAPSTYCAEQIPTIASLGAMQDWDGIVFHCWQEMDYDWRRRAMRRIPADRIDSWFNMARHPVKVVTMPFGALTFRRGDVAPGREQTAFGLTLDEEKRWLAEQSGRNWWSMRAAAMHGMTWRDALTHRVGLELGATRIVSPIAPETLSTRSDTQQLGYDLSDKAAGILTVNAPRAKAVIGFGAGKVLTLGDVTIAPGPTMQNGFSVITASAVRGDDFRSSGAAILVTATGYVENRGAVWNAEKTSVGSQWGPGPVLCEGIPFSLTLKARHAQAWALDGRGQRVTAVPAETTPDGLRFTFGPRYRTLWYELRVE
jgi:hypothetical protein